MLKKEWVLERVKVWMDIGQELVPGIPLAMPTVSYDLKGLHAGVAYTSSWRLKFNMLLLSQDMAKADAVIGHEVAHLVADVKYGYRCVHDANWCKVMMAMGLRPERCHTFDTSHLKPYVYSCPCGMEHRLTERKMHSAELGQRICTRCRGKLIAKIAQEDLDIIG